MPSRRENQAAVSLREARSMSVFCRLHPLAALRPLLAKDRLLPAARLRFLDDGQTVRVAGLNVIVHTPPTRSGVRMMFVTLEDETGLVDVVVFPDLQEKWAREIMTSQVLAVEGALSREGRQGRSVSLAATRVLTAWTGSLAGLLEKAAGDKEW
ncbi:MAG: OB-fold nucleic acid binding domain-containing protein [Thermodesulfobacteriota bacterium]